MAPEPSQGRGPACKLHPASAGPAAGAAAHPSRPPPLHGLPPCSLRKLAAPKVTPVVLLVTYAGWLTSLSVVALVPIDVYTSLAGKDTGALSTLWSISYWCAFAAEHLGSDDHTLKWVGLGGKPAVRSKTAGRRSAAAAPHLSPPASPTHPPGPRRSTQVLTWAVVPIMQGYAISGAFTVLGRVRSSLKRLWVFYLIIGALAAAVRRRAGQLWAGRAGHGALSDTTGALDQPCRLQPAGWACLPLHPLRLGADPRLPAPPTACRASWRHWRPAS